MKCGKWRLVQRGHIKELKWFMMSISCP
jgi:hypothetical protein